MGQENFSVEPYFSNLRNNMRELVEVLAAGPAGVPQSNYAFSRLGAPGFCRGFFFFFALAIHLLLIVLFP